MPPDTVEFDVILTFPDKDLNLDPNRYTGNEPEILKALLQKGLSNKKGHLTPKGRKYFSSDESRFIDVRLSSFLESNYDNHDRACAYRDYGKYVSTCPRKVTLSFCFTVSDFMEDPLRYGGKIDPLLVEQGFFNEDGYLASKAISALEQARSHSRERTSKRIAKTLSQD
ncbi:MAG: hypothetical protein Q7S11_02100 [bacterium]|nr:hypothetical protein [bacterium]